MSCYLWPVDHQPALSARLRVLTAQRLPQAHLHFHSTSCGLTTVHHLTPGSKFRKLKNRNVVPVDGVCHGWGSKHSLLICAAVSYTSLVFLHVVFRRKKGHSPPRSPWFHSVTPVCPALRGPSQSACRSARNRCETTRSDRVTETVSTR